MPAVSCGRWNGGALRHRGGKALRTGIPAEVIRRRAGRKNHEAMRPCVKIVDGLKREAMQRFGAMAGEIVGHDFCTA